MAVPGGPVEPTLATSDEAPPFSGTVGGSHGWQVGRAWGGLDQVGDDGTLKATVDDEPVLVLGILGAADALFVVPSGEIDGQRGGVSLDCYRPGSEALRRR